MSRDFRTDDDLAKFPRSFGRYASIRDTLCVDIEGTTYTARIIFDPDAGPPDEMQDGFWPSLDPSDVGYIGPKSKQSLYRARRAAHRVLDSWRNDEWQYVGIVISAKRGEWTRDHIVSLWALELHHPFDTDNRYLTEVANDLLAEAIKETQIP